MYSIIQTTLYVESCEMPGEFFKFSVAAHSLGNWSKIVWVLRFAI